MNSIFDITTTSDLPETLAKAAEGRVSPNYTRVKAVMEKAGAATVNIRQVQAAIYREFGVTMTEVTARAHLNTLVTEGVLRKPTRQTYANVVVVEG